MTLPLRSECHCGCHREGSNLVHFAACCRPDPEPDEDLIERACAAWWGAESGGKRIANCSWAEASENWKGDYRLRMKAALLEIGAWP